MGQEWIQVLKKGNKAFKQQEYSQASELFTEVLAEAKRNLRQVTVLSGENIEAVQEFCFCSKVAGNALLKNGQVSEAERKYLLAAEELKPFISNLNNPLPYRALVLTEFKSLFYKLADLYISNEQVDRLNAYVEKNAPMLKKWAEDLQLISQSVKNLN
jgi:tetratricopeptide (TPR) repeat protein